MARAASRCKSAREFICSVTLVGVKRLNVWGLKFSVCVLNFANGQMLIHTTLLKIIAPGCFGVMPVLAP